MRKLIVLCVTVALAVSLRAQTKVLAPANSAPNLTGYEQTAHKNAANGYAGLDSDAKIATSVLPTLAITDVYIVGSQAAMLALGSLDAEQGDLAIRTDESKTYVLVSGSPATLSNWVQLPLPPGTVLSVNGQTGVVSLAVADITNAESVLNKDVANGYAGLNASSKVLGTRIIYGTAANTAAEGNDFRLSDARTPTAHASTHATGGTDPVTIGPSQVTGTAVTTSDSRLSDSRTPTAHHTSHQNGGSDEIATATPGANAIPKAGAGGTLATGWIVNPLNQNTTGTAANVSGTPALPNGTTATTQAASDNSTKLATTAYADRIGFTPPTGTGAATVTSGALNAASTAITPNATASAIVSRDANANTSANNHIDGYTTTTLAGGTITLTAASAKAQFFTGISPTTVVLPVASTLVLGMEYRLVNNSTAIVTVQSSGLNTIVTMPTIATVIFTCILTSGTSAASWSAQGLARTDGGPTFASTVTASTFRSNGDVVIGNLAVSLGKVAINVVGIGTGGTNTSGWLNYNGTGRVASDLTNTTATMSNITLSQNPTLIAGRKYIGKLSIKCNNSTATEGIQFDFGGGTATFTSFAAGGGVLASGGTDVVGTNITTSSVTAISFTTLTGESWIVIEVSFVCNAAGTVIPRFAEVSSAVGTATLRANSFFSLIDTP